MLASRRTEIQIALLVGGIAVWGWGNRADVDVLKYTGIGFFAAATLLRFLKKGKEQEVSD